MFLAEANDLALEKRESNGFAEQTAKTPSRCARSLMTHAPTSDGPRRPRSLVNLDWYAISSKTRTVPSNTQQRKKEDKNNDDEHTKN